MAPSCSAEAADDHEAPLVSGESDRDIDDDIVEPSASLAPVMHFQSRKQAPRGDREQGSLVDVKLSEDEAMMQLLWFLGPSADPADLLPIRCGWLHKARPGCLSIWQARWFVLARKKLRWFKQPLDAVTLGVIDFDLVPCRVERSWEQPPQAASSSSTAPGRGTDPGPACCFRICPLEGGRVFVLRAPDEATGCAWVEDLKRHLALSAALQGPSASVSFTAEAWWKADRISPEKFAETAITGDILLFRSFGKMPRIIRAATGGHFDHVALLLRLSDNSLGLLEATGGEGVGLCTWAEFVQNEWQKLYPELVFRQVFFARSKPRLQALNRWINSVLGMPYGLSIQKLMQRNSVSAGGDANDGAFFCSQLVAEALKVLEVMPRGVSSTQFWPSTFEAAQQPPIQMSEGCTLGRQLLVDFRLGGAATAAGEGPKRARDITAAWK